MTGSAPGEGDSPRTELAESSPHPDRIFRCAIAEASLRRSIFKNGRRRRPMPLPARGARQSDSRQDWRTCHSWAERHVSTFSRRDPRPSFASFLSLHKSRGRREGRVLAAPMVTALNGLRKCAVRPTGSAETTRPSLRDGFTAYIALSLVNQRLPPSPARCFRFARIWRLHGRARTTRLCRPRLHCSSVSAPASTAFRTTFVTIAIRPLCRRGTREVDHEY
jgi:hypothetical protein